MSRVEKGIAPFFAMRKPKTKRKLLRIKTYLGRFVLILEEHIAFVDNLSDQRHEDFTRLMAGAETWSAV